MSKFINYNSVECQLLKQHFNTIPMMDSYIANIIEEYIYFSGNPDLESVCCDANEVVYMQNLCNQYNNDTASVNGNCGSVTSRIAMYPNPVGEMLHLTATEGISKVEIYSINGMLVMSSNAVSDSIEMNALKSGMYFLKVFTDEEVSTMKFIKN
jgi:hypothetical protein